MDYDKELETLLSEIDNIFEINNEWKHYRQSTINDIMKATLQFVIESENDNKYHNDDEDTEGALTWLAVYAIQAIMILKKSAEEFAEQDQVSVTKSTMDVLLEGYGNTGVTVVNNVDLHSLDLMPDEKIEPAGTITLQLWQPKPGDFSPEAVKQIVSLLDEKLAYHIRYTESYDDRT